MAGFLDLSLELRNQIYEYFLYEPLEPKSQGSITIYAGFVRYHLPNRPIRHLLQVNRQIYSEIKDLSGHLHAASQLVYELDTTFYHGRPYFSLEWHRFPALHPIINAININVDLRLREPRDMIESRIPSEQELDQLLGPNGFAKQLFNYISILLRTLVHLQSQADPAFRLLFAEAININLRRPTAPCIRPPSNSIERTEPERRPINIEEATRLLTTMRETLNATVKTFKAYDSRECDKLLPLIQIGALRFMTGGVVLGEGCNLVLVGKSDFRWLVYPENTR
ncbi:hypothetical protein CC78DRAFT_224691 [Lojkania enalia]|uniref:Uncharacterized protein n=1 Tax=Lojkania enalia TaxID=147567 RepID=A0A9P4N6G6_9PLEO|nr:hypothetical protein CC78DRAFT_224691 [Didymosphaeria enalia]